MSERTGLGPWELELLASVEDLGAGPSSRFVKSYRPVQLAAAKLDVGEVYLGEVLRDLYRPWKVLLPLVDFHGNSEAELTFNECRLTPTGAIALSSERGDSTALPIALINGNIHTGGTRPPFAAERITQALLALLEDREIADADLLSLIGPPVFPHGCDVTGDVGGLWAGRPVTLRLYPQMAVGQVGTSTVIELFNFPPAVWAQDVERWYQEVRSRRHDVEDELSSLPISDVRNIGVGVVDHSNERVQLILEPGTNADVIVAMLRSDPSPDEPYIAPWASIVSASLERPLADILRAWINANSDDQLHESLQALSGAANPQHATTQRTGVRVIRAHPIRLDPEFGVPMLSGRSKTFPPRSAREPIASPITPEEAVVVEIRRGSTIRGIVGASRIEVDLENLSYTHGQVQGNIDGRGFEFTLREAPNQNSVSLQLALVGHLDGKAVDLRAELFPPPGDLFGHSTVGGTVAGDSVDLVVEGANGGLGTSDTVAVEGQFGEHTIRLFASTNMRLGVIRGEIDSAEIHLQARSQYPDRATALSGRYSGPIPLLLLAVGILQTFM